MTLSDVCGLRYLSHRRSRLRLSRKGNRVEGEKGCCWHLRTSSQRSSRVLVRKRLSLPWQRAIMASEDDDPRPPNLFSRPPLARSALRRQIFYRRCRQRSLLPLHLSRAYRQRKELPLLPNCRRCGRSRLSSLSSLSPRMFARNPCLAWYIEPRLPCLAAHRREWHRRWWHRKSRRACWRRFASSPPSLHSSFRSRAQRGCANTPPALRKKAD